MKESLKKIKKTKELGYLERGTGKHQSNIVYSGGGISPCVTAGCGVKFWIYVIERNKSN